jgi:alkanesulfonate monooxygenase SsuD/methylene tetrahydromethanopterin reductase-like flavin-dependent oxidoreductase (luciferase family)
MLSWIAANTSRIRIASRVLGVPYRHPAVLAKMAETLDRLSGGRLILGLGGGASDAEFQAFGLGVRSPREKIDGLEEAVRIVRGMWSEQTFTVDGRLYQTDDAQIEPKPGHRIPIWLGTFGDRALNVTGRLADGWIPSLELAPPETAKPMRGRILAAARAAGRNPEQITCVYNLELVFGDVSDPRPGLVSGSVDAVVEQLLSFAEIGFTAFNFIVSGHDGDDQRERLAREVVPRVRASLSR